VARDSISKWKNVKLMRCLRKGGKKKARGMEVAPRQKNPPFFSLSRRRGTLLPFLRGSENNERKREKDSQSSGGPFKGEPPCLAGGRTPRGKKNLRKVVRR